MPIETARLTDPATVGAWIRANRKSRGWTLEQLASRAGTGVRFLSECERGKESAELGKVLIVLRALGLDLVSGQGQGSATPAPVQKTRVAQTATGGTPPDPAPRGTDQRPAEGGDTARLWDMRAVAAEIGELLAGDALNPPPVPAGARRRALERCFDVLGEAARRVTPAMQARLDHVPWRDLVARRNRLVMEYERVDEVELWRAAREEIPALLEALRLFAVSGRADPPGQ